MDGRVLIVLTAALLISACGFHLRGSNVEGIDANLSVLSPLAINGNERDLLLGTQLRRALKDTGVTVVEQMAGASILLIQNVVRDRRVLSVGTDGKVSEYELYYAVTFSVKRADGETLLPIQTVNVVRSFAFNEQEVLSKTTEQGRLYDDMRFEVVRMIIRRLQVQTKK